MWLTYSSAVAGGLFGEGRTASQSFETEILETVYTISTASEVLASRLREVVLTEERLYNSHGARHFSHISSKHNIRKLQICNKKKNKKTYITA